MIPLFAIPSAVQQMFTAFQQQYGSSTVPWPSGPVYGLYTWSGIGFVDLPWLLSTTVEAYVRRGIILNGKPVTPVSPTPVPPTPVPPTPVPPSPLTTITLPQAVRAGQFVRFKTAKPAGVYVLQGQSETGAEAQ